MSIAKKLDRLRKVGVTQFNIYLMSGEEKKPWTSTSTNSPALCKIAIAHPEFNPTWSGG